MIQEEEDQSKTTQQTQNQIKTISPSQKHSLDSTTTTNTIQNNQSTNLPVETSIIPQKLAQLQQNSQYQMEPNTEPLNPVTNQQNILKSSSSLDENQNITKSVDTQEQDTSKNSVVQPTFININDQENNENIDFQKNNNVKKVKNINYMQMYQKLIFKSPKKLASDKIFKKNGGNIITSLKPELMNFQNNILKDKNSDLKKLQLQKSQSEQNTKNTQSFRITNKYQSLLFKQNQDSTPTNKFSLANSFPNNNNNDDSEILPIKLQKSISTNSNQQSQKQEELINVSLPGHPPKTKKTKICNCKKTKCLKLYCDCFAVGELCGDLCKCNNCCNNNLNLEVRAQTIEQILEKNPYAFNSKEETNQSHSNSNNFNEIQGQDGKTQKLSKRGCNCRKTGCLKKYCCCYNNGEKCTEYCKCTECSNMHTGSDHHSHSHPIQKKVFLPEHQSSFINNNQFLLNTPDQLIQKNLFYQMQQNQQIQQQFMVNLHQQQLQQEQLKILQQEQNQQQDSASNCSSSNLFSQQQTLDLQNQQMLQQQQPMIPNFQDLGKISQPELLNLLQNFKGDQQIPSHLFKDPNQQQLLFSQQFQQQQQLQKQQLLMQNLLKSQNNSINPDSSDKQCDQSTASQN